MFFDTQEGLEAAVLEMAGRVEQAADGTAKLPLKRRPYSPAIASPREPSRYYHDIMYGMYKNTEKYITSIQRMYDM